MRSDWDMPVPRTPEPRREALDSRRGPAADTPISGLINPIELFRYILRNAVRIGLIAIALTAILIAIVLLIPFRYSATAVILADPREQNVTLQQDVLSPIGSDAAVLESMVQIVETDGFLLPLMAELGIIESVEGEPDEAQLEALGKFRKNLAAERKGATYLIDITYRGETAEEAARIANAVADTFARYHNGSLADATQNATRALSERLVELRRRLDESEKAVADYQARNGIIYLEQGGTVQKRQLAELSTQLAIARNATEQAKARYEEHAAGATVTSGAAGDSDAEAGQLNYLRQQKAELERTLAQQRLVYGPRHPRITLTRQAIGEIDRQIAEERQVISGRLRSALEVARSQQRKLEQQLASLSAGVSDMDTAEVELEALRREAAANRAIYESFLNRNKATDELAILETGNVVVVSRANEPLASDRPSLKLLTVAFGAFSGLVAIGVVVTRDGFRGSPGSARADVPPPVLQRAQATRVDPARRPAPPERKKPAGSPSLLQAVPNAGRGRSLLDMADGAERTPPRRARA